MPEMVPAHKLAIAKARAPKDPFVAAIVKRGYSIRSLAAEVGVSQATLQAHRRPRKDPNSRPIPQARAERVRELTGWPADAAHWPSGLAS